MKRIASIITGLASLAFVFPLSFAPDAAKWCVSDGNGGYAAYSVLRPNRLGEIQTLTFNGRAQSGFCPVLNYGN